MELRHSNYVLDLTNYPILDKRALIGGCSRLPLRIDGECLSAELARIPDSSWESTGTGGRLGVHMAAEALFLRGHAPAEGDKPVENRPVLELLPYARFIIEDLIPAPPLRCLVARLPPGASIAPHIDRALYFWKTLRIHIPVQTHDEMWMLCDGLIYVMKPGEVWALNNNAEHAVWNAHSSIARTHLICDFPPTPELLEILARSERDLGRRVPEAEAHFAAMDPVPVTVGGG